MITYNKLVRNKIPEIIRNDDKKCVTEILDQKSYSLELKKKLHEELAEYEEAIAADDALEELADMLELMHELAKIHGGSIEQVEEIRKQKAEERGGFKEKIFLIEAEK